MELPNRKQRRAWAKASGMLKKKQNASQSEQAEIRARAAEAGKQIHLRNTERNLEREDKLKTAKEEAENAEISAKQMEEGVSQEIILKGILQHFDLKQKIVTTKNT